MPDPKFTKPWHGVPGEEIHWNPTIIEDYCIGRSRLVYRYDFSKRGQVLT